MGLGKKTIQITFDIKDERPHHAVRLYDVTGNAIGFGQMIVKKTDEASDLFEDTPGSIVYAASIDLDVLLEKEEEVKKRAVKTITKADEPDVEDSEDQEEDNWVRGALKQFKDAKAKITLTTVVELREQYRNMKHNEAKANDDLLDNTEEDKSKTSDLMDKIISGSTPIHKGNLIPDEIKDQDVSEIKSIGRVSDGERPRIFIEDDLEDICVWCGGKGCSVCTVEEDNLTQYKQAPLPNGLRKAVEAATDEALGTYLGKMPLEAVGNIEEEKAYQKKIEDERNQAIKEKLNELHKDIDTPKELGKISLDDL